MKFWAACKLSKSDYLQVIPIFYEAAYNSIPPSLVPQGGSQKSKVKSQKYYGISCLGLFDGLLIYAVLY
jgi:hypothetical protein